jgi:alkanesulfonate monooxygenase SsuD/methylene tetrahydromethanopterin reductase-like flavin-dependent oxidoreductase (luciferase family)
MTPSADDRHGAPVRVGVRVPHANLEGDVSSLRPWLEQVDRVGLDHVCVGDHVSFHDGRGYDGLIQATALAVAHPRLPIHLALYLLPLRHPVLVARQLSTLASLAPGRIVFGVGIGGEDRHEVEIAGVNPATRGRRTDESLEVLRALLAGDTVTFHGQHFTIDEATIHPAPDPPIPILVGGRSDAALARAARSGDGWIGVWVSPDRFANTTAAVESAARDQGRDGVAWRHELLVWCGFGDTPADARRHLAPEMENLYKTGFERFERYAPHGTIDDIADALRSYVDAGARSFDLVAVAGDADTALECVAGVRSLLVS